MACYQAYIGVTCVLALLYLIKLIIEHKKIGLLLRYCIDVICGIIFAGICYWCVTQLLLLRAQVSLSAYKGAGNVSVGNIISGFPNALPHCYKEYFDFFITDRMYLSLSMSELLILGIAIIALICVIGQFISLLRWKIGYAVFFLISVIALPVAANVVLIIAAGNVITELMAMGMLLSVMLPCIVLPKKDTGKEDRSESCYIDCFRRIAYFAMGLVVWFQIAMVTNDQLALKEGKDATVNLTQNIISTLIAKDYLQESEIVAFVGRPAENDMFAQSYAYQNANVYAKFGTWSTSPGNLLRTWNGVCSNYLAMNINFCGEDDYELLRQNSMIKEMPEFPDEGSIQIINGILVVKISELY